MVPTPAGDSVEVIGLGEVIESDSPSHLSKLTNSSNSSVGVATHACARFALVAPASAAPSRSPHSCLLLLLMRMPLLHPCMLH